MNILSIKDLWKRTENRFELKDVSLAIYENEWLLITGPVNEGKEALQKILLGFDEDWHGTIYFESENIKKIENYSEQVAFIHNHFVEVGIKDNIYHYLALPLRLKGLTEQEIYRNIRKVTEETFINLNFHTFVKDLSFREKLIVALLRAILTKPKLLIIEEPFFELTNNKRKIVISVFKKFLRNWNGSTVVIFSSYTSEWFEVCDRAILMNHQSIVQIGEKKELLDNPQQIFVTKYIDRTAITYIKGCFKANAFFSKGLTFTVPYYLQKGLLLFEGQTVFIGMKAMCFQNIDELCINKEDGFTVSLPIHFLKETDDHYTVYSNIGGEPLVAEIKNNGKIYEGQNLLLHYSYKDLLFFDGVTEIKLKRRG